MYWQGRGQWSAICTGDTPCLDMILSSSSQWTLAVQQPPFLLSNAKRPGTNVPGRFAPIDTFLEIAKTFLEVGSRSADVTTPADVIYSVAKMVRSFVVRRMREEPSGCTEDSSDLAHHGVP